MNTTRAIKQRYRRAVRSAMKQLQMESFSVFRTDGEIDLIAVDHLAHARLIKICLDEEIVPGVRKLANVPLEIWVRGRGEKEFRKIFF